MLIALRIVLGDACLVRFFSDANVLESTADLTYLLNPDAPYSPPMFVYQFPRYIAFPICTSSL